MLPRITLGRAAARVVGALTLASCTGAAAGVGAQPAVLRGALLDWQEGPTDGRVCLDPHVLPPAGDSPAPRARWADSVLAALLADSLVALDTTAAARRFPGQRACAPAPGHPRVALGRPRVRGDSADIETAAWTPAAAGASARETRIPAVLARRGARWYFARRPGQHSIE